MHRSLLAVTPLLTASFFGFAPVAGAGTIAYATAQASRTASVFGTLDLNTGVFTPIATLDNIFVNDLAFAPNGKLYLLTTSFKGSGPAEFATINTSTGAVTDVAPNTDALNSIAFGPGGILYATSFALPASENLYILNPVTGAASLVGALSPPLNTSANDIRFLGGTA